MYIELLAYLFLKVLTENTTHLKLRHGILKVLVYFDLFDYPVSKNEIIFFLDQKNISVHEISVALDELIIDECIFRYSEFYSIQTNAEIAERRITGNINAEKLFPVGKKVSQFLYQFPFTRGIGISGSLSKNFALENDDIDYFIITKANRLWICRTILHLLKKVSFIINKQHLYCMNYFIDEHAMEIEEKNIFTAMELITLIPVCGNGTMDKFFTTNYWVGSYFPNYKLKMQHEKTYTRNSILKRVFEFFLDNKLGDFLDNYLMKITTRRWKKKEQNKKVNSKGNRMGLSTGKHFAKPNPDYFQQKIVSGYVDKLNENAEKWNRQFE